MKQLIEFIETLSIDDRLFWRCSDLDGKMEYEVLWHRGMPEPWHIRKMKADWTRVATKNLIATLDSYNIDKPYLEKAMSISVLTQAAYADLVIDGATRIFGKDAVATSLVETRKFFDEVAITVGKMTNQEKRQHLSVVLDPASDD